MGIFSSIRDSIFGGPAEAAEEPAPAPVTPAPAGKPAASAPTATAAPATPAAKPAAAPAAPAASNVDVAAILDQATKAAGQKLDWRHSIVDLLKVLGIDSSLSARKELANELNYTGDTSDSAKMNTWLHKEVLRKLAENGGKVPADLLD